MSASRAHGVAQARTKQTARRAKVGGNETLFDHPALRDLDSNALELLKELAGEQHEYEAPPLPHEEVKTRSGFLDPEFEAVLQSKVCARRRR